MFPYLREKVVLVPGHEAVGVYDLNCGKFHRLNIEAGELLRLLDGQRSIEEYALEEREFIGEAIELGIVFWQNHPETKRQTQLEEVLRKTRPVRFAWIELTSKCNQVCAHCFLGDELNRYPHVPKENIFAYFKTLSDVGARQIILSGGEPTVHPDFLQILQVAARYQFRISLLTNASHRNFQAIIPALQENEVTVKVPILGWGRTHDEMTGLPGSFERTIKNIQLLWEAGIRLELGTTVTAINFQSISKIREYANSLELPLEVSPVYAIGYAQKNKNRVLEVEENKIIEACRKDKLQQPSKVRSYPPERRKQYASDKTDYEAVNLRDYLTEHQECGQKIIAILSSGEVTPCLMLRHQKFSLGSTKKFSLEEILARKSDRSKEFDELFSLKNIPGCEGCEARFICKAGGCPASSFAALGSVQLKNPHFKRCYYLNRHNDEITAK